MQEKRCGKGDFLVAVEAGGGETGEEEERERRVEAEGCGG